MRIAPTVRAPIKVFMIAPHASIKAYSTLRTGASSLNGVASGNKTCGVDPATISRLQGKAARPDSLEAQMARAQGARGASRLYAEKRSGAETDRKALAKLMEEASPGDTVVVTRLDRLARSTRDLLNLLDRLSKDDIGFKSLRETSVDTTSPQGRLVVNILASISEFERELIHARMTEGRKRAVANGVKFGPKFQAQFISASGSTRPSSSR